jgi:hypothetical protein
VVAVCCWPMACPFLLARLGLTTRRLLPALLTLPVCPSPSQPTVDTTAPDWPPPSTVNQTAEATSASGAAVAFTFPIARDSVAPQNPAVTCTAPGTAPLVSGIGTAFVIGTTPVTCSATDAAGNTALLTFSVTVGEVLREGGCVLWHACVLLARLLGFSIKLLVAPAVWHRGLGQLEARATDTTLPLPRSCARSCTCLGQCHTQLTRLR